MTLPQPEDDRPADPEPLDRRPVASGAEPPPGPQPGPGGAAPAQSPYALRIALASIGCAVFLAGTILGIVVAAPPFVIFVLAVGAALAGYNVVAVVLQRRRSRARRTAA